MRLFALVLLPSVAFAAEIDTLKRQLLEDEVPEASEAARRLGESTDPKALDALLDALAVGAPPKLQAEMLAALAGKKDPRAVDVLCRYTKNRNPELRKKAVTALSELPGEKAVGPLLESLSDPVEEVRAQAALALGKRKERRAEPRLIKLLEHHDQAASSALALIATPELAHRLAELIGTLPDALVCGALGSMLKRTDFGPDPVRVEVVRALGKVPGMESTSELVEYLAATEKDKSRPSRSEAQKIVDQRSGQ